MGLLDCIFGRSTTTTRHGMSPEYRAALREMRKQQSKLYRTMRMAVIFAAIMAAALFILALFVSDLRNEWVFKFVFIIFALCAGGGLTLPWITQFERDRKKIAKGEAVASWRKIAVYVAWGLIAVCSLLWIISVFVLGDSVKALIEHIGSDSNAELDLGTSFIMLRVSVIVTLQVAVGTVIVTNTMRYGKKYFALRIIMYVALLYLDIYLSWIVGGVTIAAFNEGGFMPFESTLLWVLAVMMTVALITAGGIFGGQARRKEIELFMKGDMKALTEGEVDLIDTKTDAVGWGMPAPTSAPKQEVANDPEKQLIKIKELLDKGIITEEEYQAKRKDIIDKM